MDLSSSPLPVRRKAEFFDDIEDFIDDFSDFEDELAAKVVPATQSPYFTQPTQLVGRTSLQRETQPTQIVPPRQSLKLTALPLRSPSPKPIIEVPASSPFQPRRPAFQPGKFAMSMAPPGTVYCPPVRAAAVAGQKRTQLDLAAKNDDDGLEPKFAGKISFDDKFVDRDSSDDERPTRGDIRKTNFTARPAVQQSKVTLPKSPTQRKIKFVQDVLENKRAEYRTIVKVHKAIDGKITFLKCNDALIRHNGNTKAAIKELKAAVSSSQSNVIDLTSSPPSPQPWQIRLAAPTTYKVYSVEKAMNGKFSYRECDDALVQNHWDEEATIEQLKEILSSWQGNMLDLTSSPPPRSNPTTPVAPRRGRLMRGRRVPVDSSPNGPDPLSINTPLVISSGDEDEYQQASSPLGFSQSSQNPKQLALEERVLELLNTCDKTRLKSIARISDASAEIMLQHQPFTSVRDARAVVMASKARKSKSKKIALGDEVVDAVIEFTEALEAVTRNVEECEQRGEKISAITATWNIDDSGRERDLNDNRPLTPTSMSNSPAQLHNPPWSEEPVLMKGHCKMKPYQIYGLNWMHLLYEKKFGGILADDMGLGKTCQVISLLCAVVESYHGDLTDDEKRPWPNLIVVPPSTLDNWVAEFAKFAPDLEVVTYSGPQPERDQIAEDIMEKQGNIHVILTSYSQLGRPEDIHHMQCARPTIAVFDEGHKLKNPNTQLYKNLIRLTDYVSWRLLLTGTPVQNNFLEMIALLGFVEPELFRGQIESLENLFKQKATLEDVSNGAMLVSERVKRARTILKPFILQRRKEQVLEALPPKTTTVVYCSLEDSQKSIYKFYERRFKRGKDGQSSQVEAPTAGSQSEIEVTYDNNNVWMQLRKSAIHPQLFRASFDNDKVEKMAHVLMRSVDQAELRQTSTELFVSELKNCSDFELHLWCRDYPRYLARFDVPNLSWMQSGKVQALLQLIHKYQANGDRVLVFTRFAKVIEILSECLATEGISYLALQGSTDVSERQYLINQFNDDPSITAFLLTTGAGGTGINLTSANKVVIFDQSDNPQDDIQAENRAHRLGQQRSVEIVKLVTKDTIEELVLKAGQKKIELANRVTGWEGGLAQMASGEMEKTVREQLLEMENTTTPTSSD